MYGFVYLWYDRKHKRFYVGKHRGTIDDGYVCSSKWMKQAYSRRPEDFKRRILKWVDTREELNVEEQRWLNMIKLEELGKKYYNLRRDGSFKGGPLSESCKLALSRAGKGKKKSPGHVAKVAAANKGKNSNEAFRQMRREKMKGKSWATYTPERNAKIASSLRGRPLSEEHRAKLRAGHARRREQLNIENR